MSEVRSATGARNFHSEDRRGRAAFVNRFFADRLPETRPAGAGFKFGARVEQRAVAADAAIDATGMQVPGRTGKCDLGSLSAGNVIRQRR